jgi:hypothetical protein
MEKAICSMAAMARRAGNSPGSDRQISKQDPYEMDLHAFGAEMAFCKLLNVYPDFNDKPGTYDCISHNGNKIDVKYTKIEHGRLLCRFGSNSHASIYVLMTGTFPKYVYRGFATRDELHASLIDINGVKTYALSQDKLR